MKLKGIRLVITHARETAVKEGNTYFAEFCDKVLFQVESIEQFLGIWSKANKIEVHDESDTELETN